MSNRQKSFIFLSHDMRTLARTYNFPDKNFSAMKKHPFHVIAKSKQ